MSRISRRSMNRLLLAAPIAAVAAGSAAQDSPKPSPLAACLVSSDTTLGADDRARAEKGIAGVEQALSAVRDFKLPPDTDPAFRFAPMMSRRNR
jgi:hypothetical protein